MTIDSILVAVDGSDAAVRAVELAAELASKCGSALTVLHVQDAADAEALDQAMEGYSQHEHRAVSETELVGSIARQLLDRAEARARRAGAETVQTVLRTGDPAHEIVEAAKARGVGLIVVGRRGRGVVAELLMGSVSHSVTQRAPCACLAVP
jgi:nucleotide-binding universal stress UspA family protein